MKKSKKKILEKKGWKVGDTKDFLNLSDQEATLIEVKHALMQLVRKVRQDQDITQQALAEILESSQSRIAKLENASDDVSLDLIFRCLYTLGVSNKLVAKAISSVK
ncbi:MAG: XRE family transcriptional regulator [Bdellovibrionota bacterium]